MLLLLLLESDWKDSIPPYPLFAVVRYARSEKSSQTVRTLMYIFFESSDVDPDLTFFRFLISDYPTTHVNEGEILTNLA